MAQTRFDGRRAEQRGRLLPLKYVTYRPGSMGEDLLARGENAGTAARAALWRYLWLMRRAKETLRLTPGEAQVLVTALRDYELNETTLDLIWAKVDAEIRRHGLGQLHDVDAQALVDKLRDLSPVQAAAVVDAAEVFWRTGADREALLRSGLLAA